MYRFLLSVEIQAPVSRVWRALCEPREVVQWDSGVLQPIDAPPDYPQPGQHVRWRYRSRVWRILHDRPAEVEPERRLRSKLDLGPYRMDETYELQALGEACRLDLQVELAVHLPLIGPLIERLHAGRLIRSGFEDSLAGLKRYCETPG